MVQQRGGKRVAPRTRGRRARQTGNSFLLPIILGVVILLLLAVKLGLSFFATRSSAPVPPDWVQQELLEVNPFSRPGTKLEDVTGWLCRNGVPKRFWPERLELIDRIPHTGSGKVKKYLLKEELEKRMEGPEHND